MVRRPGLLNLAYAAVWRGATGSLALRRGAQAAGRGAGQLAEPIAELFIMGGRASELLTPMPGYAKVALCSTPAGRWLDWRPDPLCKRAAT